MQDRACQSVRKPVNTHYTLTDVLTDSSYLLDKSVFFAIIRIWEH